MSAEDVDEVVLFCFPWDVGEDESSQYRYAGYVLYAVWVPVYYLVALLARDAGAASGTYASMRSPSRIQCNL